MYVIADHIVGMRQSSNLTHIQDLEEVEEWNEFGELADNLGPPVPIDQTTAASASGATPGSLPTALESKDQSTTSDTKSTDQPVQQLAALATQAASIARRTADKAAEKVTEALPSNDYVAAKKATESEYEATTAGAVRDGQPTSQSDNIKEEVLPIRQAKPIPESSDEKTAIDASVSTPLPEVKATVDIESLHAAERDMAASAEAATLDSAPPAAPEGLASGSATGVSPDTRTIQDDPPKAESGSTVAGSRDGGEVEEAGGNQIGVNAPNESPSKAFPGNENADTGVASPHSPLAKTRDVPAQANKAIDKIADTAESNAEVESAQPDTNKDNTDQTLQAASKDVLAEAKIVTENLAAQTSQLISNTISTSTATAASIVSAISPSNTNLQASGTAEDTKIQSPLETSESEAKASNRAGDDQAESLLSTAKDTLPQDENVKPTQVQPPAEGELATVSVAD